ncbi:MAG: (2Fe-2S) ferredoxin domain-containing protein [Candidatus Wallbacteria bacterium]|nr:(2Fe-2S) ferredoxin domain-containing protein [Candidatus Wallbacteria bacterium]
MPPPFKRHVFVCTNQRPPGHPKGCCAEKGSEEVRDYLKAELHRRGLKTECRTNAAGCLDACEAGVSVVVYPEGVWYGGVTKADVDEIIEQHLIGGKPVERLLMKPFAREKKE